MKKLYPLIILLSFLITTTGCQKETQADIEQTLVGSWEIRDVIGGQMPGDHASEPGNGNVIQFTDTDYSYIIGGKVTYTGKYSVSVTGSGQNKDYILHLINNGLPREFEIEGNKLTIYEGRIESDGATVIYERVKEPVLHTN